MFLNSSLQFTIVGKYTIAGKILQCESALLITLPSINASVCKLVFIHARKTYLLNITVEIKWNVTGNIIQICKGTRQGGLSSPLLFNLF